MKFVEKMKKKFYPDGSKDGTLIFYNWLRQYIKSDYVVLNVGAGLTADIKIRSLRGEVKQVIGVDIDKAVLNNKDLDQAFVIEKNKLPFEDNHFDIAWADFVLEHVEDPLNFVKEVNRVLKNGGSFFFRTPNKYHYVSFIASITPLWFHKLVVNRMHSLPDNTYEQHETFYRFNTKKSVLENSHSAGFRNIDIKFIEADPSYMVFHPLLFLLGTAYERFVNAFDSCSMFRANIFGRLVK